MKKTKQELPDCPFCGGDVEWCDCGSDLCTRLLCEGCGCEFFWESLDREEIKKKFNKRQ